MPYTNQRQCPKCDSLRDASDMFCGNCGIAIKEDQTQQNDNITTFVKQSPLATTFVPKRVIPDSHQTLSNEPQTIKYQEEDTQDEQWMELRWFIFALGILSLLFLPLTFFFQTSVVISIVICLALASITLGCIQTSHLNQWYWFAFLLLLGPLAGIIYGWLHPKTKQDQLSPPRQLIMIILWLGFIWLGVSLVLHFQDTDKFTQIYLGICGDLLFAGTILALIRAIKLKHLNEESAILMAFFLAAPLIALIYVMSPDSKDE